MAELSCGGSCMKYILLLFNIIFFLCGAAVLGVGIWAKVDDSFSDYIEIVNFDNSNPYFDQAVYMLIAIGAIIFLVGFLGCCGACCDSPTLLLFYAILLGIIAILQIAAGALAITFREELGENLKTQMATQVNTEVTNDTSDPLTAAWYAVQVEFKCCGANNYTDYQNSLFEKLTEQHVPETCCALNNSDPENPKPNNPKECQEDANKIVSQSDFLHTEGCYDEMVTWIEDNVVILIAIAFAIALIELIGIIFACCVRSELNSGSKY